MSAAVERSAPGLLTEFSLARRQSLLLCAPLSPEDMMVQSCPEASPAKWHLAHTTWFFETFVLREYLDGYRPFHADFHWLFNSYYNQVSDQPAKLLRASFSRPSLAEILAYRRHVEEAVERLEAQGTPEEAARRIELGIHHEQQHQELLCYDVKHALWTNPLRPAYLPGEDAGPEDAVPLSWQPMGGGLFEIGHGGAGFCYDNELPRHREYLEPFAIASRAVTCAEYLRFIEDGGYRRPELWLSEGWETVQERQWEAPLYWQRGEEGWSVYTLRGVRPMSAAGATPVCHVSYFEADAYARWAGCRLPSESEWERAAATVARIPEGANLLEEGWLHPRAAGGHGLTQIFGDVWEWTRSAYLGYPGYRAPEGALGEYNGKFMCNQMVLRGGSAVTPRAHIRSTYRNFFSPATRWQFAGFRLAKDQQSPRG